MPQITDPDVAMLAGIAGALKRDYVRFEVEQAWANSPFLWIKSQPSRRVGKIGEQLVAGWCAAKGLSVEPSRDTEADRIISGKRVEIKFSMLWESGVYTFQQFRDQRYEYAICLGISPFDAHCWVLSKEVLKEKVIGHRPQHKGRAGTETFWLSIDPANPEEWLKRYGGTLREAYDILKKL